MFSTMYIIDVDVLTKMYSNLPITKLSVVYSQVLIDLIQFIIWSNKNPQPVYGDSIDIYDLNRIRTVSFLFLDKNEQIPLFNLRKSALGESKFFFLFTQEELDERTDVINVIEAHLNDVPGKKHYGVYLVDNVRSCHFGVGCTNVVQD